MTMRWIDCHAHVYPPQFTMEEIDQMMEEASTLGNISVIATPESIQDCQMVLKMSKTRSWMYPCAGLHPIQPLDSVITQSDLLPAQEFIRKHANELVAIGEVGLDYSPRYVPKDDLEKRHVQVECLKKFANLSNETRLPLNVHSRQAAHYAIETLSNHPQGVLLHAYDGKAHHAVEATQKGFVFSVPPCIVRSPQIQKWVQRVDLKYLVLETDCPSLGPTLDPNRLYNLKVSAQAIVDIKNQSNEKSGGGRLSLEDVVSITTENAIRLFPKLA